MKSCLDTPKTDIKITEEEAEKQAKELVKVFKDENPGADRVPKVTGHYCDGQLHQLSVHGP